MATDNKKKFVIKPFKPRNQMDEAAAQGIWAGLNKAIQQIHGKNASKLSFEELYRSAYNLVLHKHGPLLYAGVQESVQVHLQGVAGTVAETPDDGLLEGLSKQWKEHEVTMVMVRDILMYMDRTFVTQQKKVPVYDLGLNIFRDSIARHEKVKGRLSALLLAAVEKERGGMLIDRSLLKNTLSMLVDLGVDGTSVYEEDFERHFLEATRAFYQVESLAYISQNTCHDYMRKAEQRLQEEAARATHYLNLSTEPKLKHIVETELIAKHAKTLVEMENSGCVSMFRDDKVDDLGRMYDLFSRVPLTLDELRGSMCAFVKKTGRDLVSDSEGTKDPVTFVQALLNLRDKFDVIVTEAFQGEKKAQKKLKEAFEDFINMDARCANFLAQYVDDLLKSGLRGMSEDEAEIRLEKVIVIFRFLQDKDVFENYYKVHLSKRLLCGRSVSDEAEKNMIAKLKTECGYQFTSKLEGMFTDMQISLDTMETYRQSGKHKSKGVELDVNVLTTGYWPSHPDTACRLPPVIVGCCEEFEKFYLDKHQGRKILWRKQMGNCDIKATFSDGRRHELHISTYQMCILMLFNDSETLSLNDIREATEIPEGELRRHLVSLCTPKHRILKKASKGKAIAQEDVFRFNAAFTSKLKRVRVPLVSHRDAGVNGPGGAGGMNGAGGGGGDSAAGTLPPAVEEDRRHLVEAAVVRIMKTRKTLHHHDLIAETTRQLNSRFVPEPQFIKKRIESLIEREYLERNAKDRKQYNYLA